MKGADLAGFVVAIDNDAGSIDAGLDGGREGPGKFALGPLDVNEAGIADVQLDLRGEGDGFFSDTRHGFKSVCVFNANREIGAPGDYQT